MSEHGVIEATQRERTGMSREDYGVLVGWTHSECGVGIDLKVQSATSSASLKRGEITANHLLMTRNQALLLARYLLEATGQRLPEEQGRHGWRAWIRRRRH